MNPVEIGTGKSFKGLAAYLLHDVREEGEEVRLSSDRVGWAQSFNLDGAGPDSAWRLMAATALSADQLKAAAGIKKGKPAVNTAYHFSLNFNPADHPTEDMERAAVVGALEALGLQDYQALAVSHEDKAHRHVHVMVNLIHPETGISAASKQPGGRPSPLSNSQRKLSSWAQKFERENRLEVTEGRLANANKREQGEVVDARRKPRNVYDREKQEGTDKRFLWLKDQQKEEAAKLTSDGREMREAHRTQWDVLKAAYAAQKSALAADKDKAISRRIDELKELYRPAWSNLYAIQRMERQDFERGERSTLGKIWHGMAVVKDRALSQDLLGGFVAAFSREARLAIVERKHGHERERLAFQSRQEMTAEIDRIKLSHAMEREQARLRFMEECRDLRAVQDQAHADMRSRWQSYNEARRAAFKVKRAPAMDQTREQGRGRGLEPG